MKWKIYQQATPRATLHRLDASLHRRNVKDDIYLHLDLYQNPDGNWWWDFLGPVRQVSDFFKADGVEDARKKALVAFRKMIKQYIKDLSRVSCRITKVKP